MLTATNKMDSYRLELEGENIRVFQLVRKGKYVTKASLGVGAKWSFENQQVAASLPGMAQSLVDFANEIFGPKLRELDAPRQGGLFPDGCSVCGIDRNTFPETAVRDTSGNIVETNGKPWVTDDEPIRWTCHVCNRLVCRNCTLVWPDSGTPHCRGEYYHHTYCSEACRAAAPVGFAHEDENMR